jgi:CRP/FNR family transcriptional regulator, cyclic AMP receptor protein
VLDRDPELGANVSAAEFARARAMLVARMRSYERGLWEQPETDERHIGYLVLDGLLARDVILAGKTCTELLGPGDVLHPQAAVQEDALVRYRVRWHVLEPLRVAVLDEHFSRRLGEWPEVMRTLLDRALRRSLRVSLHAALLQLSPVETRLLILFWFLAERWGKVTPGGVVLDLHLSHRTLGQLVGCQRASVTTALHRVEDSGLVSRRGDGSWLLHGAPPDELAQIHWQERAGTAA